MRNRIDIPEGFYGITCESCSKGRSNAECVLDMIKGGAKIIQYREKDKSMREKLMEAKEIAKICKDNGVVFIVNDHIDIALLTDADGLHIGQDDISPADARRLLGNDKIIGLSTHNEEQARLADLDYDIDYIGVGPLYKTNTKVVEPVGIEYLEYTVKNINVSQVAIGGIKMFNIEDVIKKGATSIALVSEVLESDDISSIVEEINCKIVK